MKEAPGSSETWFLQEPHGVTTQKTPFFIVTAVKTSNLTAKTASHWKRETFGQQNRGTEYVHGCNRELTWRAAPSVAVAL
jgi:hypothetical protein